MGLHVRGEKLRRGAEGTEVERWGEVPYCRSKNVVEYGKWEEYLQKYRCEDCLHYFNDLTGTISDRP